MVVDVVVVVVGMIAVLEVVVVIGVVVVLVLVGDVAKVVALAVFEYVDDTPRRLSTRTR